MARQKKPGREPIKERKENVIDYSKFKQTPKNEPERTFTYDSNTNDVTETVHPNAPDAKKRSKRKLNKIFKTMGWKVAGEVPNPEEIDELEKRCSADYPVKKAKDHLTHYSLNKTWKKPEESINKSTISAKKIGHNELPKDLDPQHKNRLGREYKEMSRQAKAKGQHDDSKQFAERAKKLLSES